MLFWLNFDNMESFKRKSSYLDQCCIFVRIIEMCTSGNNWIKK